MAAPTFFEHLKAYVGFTDETSATLRAFHSAAAPHFGPIMDDFYASIEADPGASAVITGGRAQIERLKGTLRAWVDRLLLGPHDEAYYQMRARIGRVHVRIDLEQVYMFTAMNRIRVRLLAVAAQAAAHDTERFFRTAEAIDKIVDIELAIMLETYREDLLEKNRTAERLATIGQFAAGIGHELRNPLGVIESSLFILHQQLGKAGAIDPRVQKHLDRMAGELKRSNKTISDLLELARSRPPARHRVLVRPLLEAAPAAARLSAAIELQIDAPDDLTLDADPDQMTQVITNLLVNASQAMGGRGRIRLEGTRAGTATQIRVRDSGPGVHADVRHKIFEALFTTKAKGSGLGLALSRRIAEAHGGTLALEPSDSGATFVLTVPDEETRGS